VRRSLPLIAAASLAAASLATFAIADTWPRFRGANGDGQGQADDVPSAFTDADYAWKLPLPGIGHSSPVVWDDRVFITSADPETAELIVMCVDLKTSKELWQRRYAASPYKMHLANSFATSTPAVDANQIYFAWRKGENICMASVTHDGEKLWQEDIGHLNEEHGFGASPMIAGDVVCICHDTLVADDSYILALDRRTGHEAWRTPCATGKTSFSTPFLWESPSGKELIVATTMAQGVTAYDPATGKEVWNGLTKDLPDRSVSSPIITQGMVLISCGAGNNGLHLIGAKLSDDNQPPVEVYRLKKSIPNLPTPVVADDMVFMLYDRGIMTCLDPTTGKTHWVERLGGNFHSSPLHVGNRIFCISLEGEVIVMAASKQYELIARTKLDEPVTATPAIANGRMLIRTEKSLICLGGKR
jgi:outer membrane protein assembly factor BamB